MATEKRLIDANVLIEDLEAAEANAGMGAVVARTLIRYVKRCATVDAVEVVHGQWEAKDSGFDWELKCSLCGEQYWIEKDELETHKPNYCPRCGAKMDGGINK